MIEFPPDPPLGWLEPGWEPVRIPLLLLEVGMAIFGAHIAFKFFKNNATLKETSRGSRMHAAWGWLFTGYTVTILLYIIADFYTLDIVSRYNWLTFGYVSMATGALFYIYNIETVGVIRTKHIFSIIFGGLYIVLIILLVSAFAGIVSGDFIQYFAISFLVPMILLFFTYTVKINRLIKGKMKVYSAIMIAGLALFLTGWIGATDAAIRLVGIGNWMRLIADIMQLVGLGILGLFFSFLPSWREIEWRAALKSLFVIYQGGTCVYQHDFTGRQDATNTTTLMVGGVVEMVKSVLDQVLSSGSQKVIDFKDKKLVLKQGKQVTVAVVADNVSDSLDYVLNEFTNRFEVFFDKVLKDWNGDSSVFEPSKVLIKWLFD